VGEEHDPDPPARQQGAGRDLTCQPYPGAAATSRGFSRTGVGLMAGYGPAGAPADSAPMRLPGCLSQRSHAVPAAKITKRYELRPQPRFSSRLQALEQLGQTPARSVLSIGVGLFVPKPSTDVNCQRRSIPGLGQTVRRCPLNRSPNGPVPKARRHYACSELVVRGRVELPTFRFSGEF